MRNGLLTPAILLVAVVPAGCGGTRLFAALGLVTPPLHPTPALAVRDGAFVRPPAP